MATVPSFRTWNVGEVVTAAFMNSNIRDAGNFFVAEPVFEILQSTGQSLATSSAFIAITFDASVFDPDGGHSNVTNNSRYTAKTPGWFYLTGAVSFAANATGSRGTQWAKNGSAILQSGALDFAGTAGTTITKVAKSQIVQFNGSTDYVELQGFQSSGGALNTSAVAQDGSVMVGKWVHN